MNSRNVAILLISTALILAGCEMAYGPLLSKKIYYRGKRLWERIRGVHPWEQSWLYEGWEDDECP